MARVCAIALLVRIRVFRGRGPHFSVSVEDHEKNREFVRLFTRDSRAVYSYILTLVLSQSDADEVYQETSSVMWEKFDQFEPGSNFYAWACRIAYYEVHNFRKRRRPRVAVTDRLIELLAEETLALSDELPARQEALQACLGKLSEADRGLIQRRYWGEQPVKAIADAIDRPMHWVYRALSRIHEALLRCIERTLQSEAHG